ncbi:MAG: aspartate aminotransferase family protein [Candidatus Bathyarchaeia archaeon]
MSEKLKKENEVKSLHSDAKSYLIPRWEPRPNKEDPIVVRGEGAYFWDAEGKRYLDFCSQLYNVNIGLGNREIIEASKKQLDELAYASPEYNNIPKIQLAKRLAQITGGKLCKTFFGNSGAEANEVAIKLAQSYRSAEKMISFWDAYHGSTYATVSIGGSARSRLPGLSIIEEFKHVASPYCYRCVYKKTYPECDLLCAEFIRYTIEKEGEKQVAAFFAEPICSWAGQVVPPPDYWQRIRKICDEKGVLLVFDEIMTGFARTGKMFAYEHWNVVPDIMTLAKGITAGYVPLGATIVNKKLGDYFDEHGFAHSYTYSGHALACATSLAVIDYYYKEKLAERAATTGAYMIKRLKEMQERLPIMGDVRGLGLFMGVELVANPETKEELQPHGMTPEQSGDPDFNSMLYVIEKAKKSGLMVGKGYGASIIRMMPTLVMTEEQADEGLKILEETLKETEKKFNLPKKQ